MRYATVGSRSGYPTLGKRKGGYPEIFCNFRRHCSWFETHPGIAAAVFLAAGAAGSNAAEKKPAKIAEEPGWNDAQMQQPTIESLDLNAYNAIREEGLQHSHVMDYAGGLMDGIGPRLTGSPNMAKANAWTRDQLTKMGCVNAHLEDWGEFGMGWQQLNTWVRMTEPDTSIFLAQATPWSPSTNGPVTAQAISVVINDEKDIAKYKGKLSRQDCAAGPDARCAGTRQGVLRALHRQGSQGSRIPSAGWP